MRGLPARNRAVEDVSPFANVERSLRSLSNQLIQTSEDAVSEAKTPSTAGLGFSISTSALRALDSSGTDLSSGLHKGVQRCVAIIAKLLL